MSKKIIWHVLWDNGIDCIDGFNRKTLKEAKSAAMQVLDGWISAAYVDNYSDEDWNQMIANAYVEVWRFEGKVPEDYGDYCYWHPSERDLEKIGWVLRDEDGVDSRNDS